MSDGLLELTAVCGLELPEKDPDRSSCVQKRMNDSHFTGVSSTQQDPTRDS